MRARLTVSNDTAAPTNTTWIQPMPSTSLATRAVSTVVIRTPTVASVTDAKDEKAFQQMIEHRNLRRCRRGMDVWHVERAEPPALAACSPRKRRQKKR